MRKKKGAVPVPYIIALLLGIAVVAILGYWFFVLGGARAEEMNLQKCTTRAHTYCSRWRTAGWALDNAGDPTIGWFEDEYPRCEAFASQLGFSGRTNTATDQTACEEALGI